MKVTKNSENSNVTYKSHVTTLLGVIKRRMPSGILVLNTLNHMGFNKIIDITNKGNSFVTGAVAISQSRLNCFLINADAPCHLRSLWEIHLNGLMTKNKAQMCLIFCREAVRIAHNPRLVHLRCAQTQLQSSGLFVYRNFSRFATIRK